MTVQDLIDNLQMLMKGGLSSTAIVKAFDPNSEQMEPVSGFLYDNKTVEVCTDED
jgi:hypothetical protein